MSEIEQINVVQRSFSRRCCVAALLASMTKLRLAVIHLDFRSILAKHCGTVFEVHKIPVNTTEVSDNGVRCAFLINIHNGELGLLYTLKMQRGLAEAYYQRVLVHKRKQTAICAEPI